VPYARDSKYYTQSGDRAKKASVRGYWEMAPGAGRRVLEALEQDFDLAISQGVINPDEARSLLAEEGQQILDASDGNDDGTPPTLEEHMAASRRYWKHHADDPDEAHRHAHASHTRLASESLPRRRRIEEVAAKTRNTTRKSPFGRLRRRNSDGTFDGELHRKMQCRSAMCGGHGAAMPHAVHTLRETGAELRYRSDRHAERIATMDVRDQFIIGTALVHAARAGSLRLSEILASGDAVRAGRSAKKHLFGEDFDPQQWIDSLYTDHANGYSWAHATAERIFADEDGSGLLSFLWQQDPHIKTRRTAWEWLKAHEHLIEETQQPETGRKLSYIGLLVDEQGNLVSPLLANSTGYVGGRRLQQTNGTVRTSPDLL
jgi:hypothetical protein